MKKLLITSLLSALIIAGTILRAQDQPPEYLGLPGDNLNLYAVMNLFQESKTLEAFEKELNDPDTRINNLDLNGDNYVDYIRVTDDVDGDVHNIILQDMIDQNEIQDVAVFTVQRFPDGQVQIQLTGDEDLYGKNYIIEPITDDQYMGETPNPGYIGDARTIYGRNVTIVTTTPVQIAAWPLIRFIYNPRYIVWHSRWYWGFYPAYWHPWRPFYWHYYYGYHYSWYNVYYSHYRRWNIHRYPRWNTFYYTSRRAHSPIVTGKIHTGNYRATYSHPEQRREGEAYYARTVPAHNRKPEVNTSRSTARRTNTPDNESHAIRTNKVSRRTGAAVTTRTVNGPKPGKSTQVTRRSTTTVNAGNAGNRRAESNSTVSRRTTTVKRTTASPASSGRQSTATKRTTVRSAGANSSTKRSNSSSKTVKTGKNSRRIKDKDKSDSSGR